MRTLSRRQVIDRLRDHLLQYCDDDHSICEAAAKMGIFCRGFARLNSTELRERYGWLEDKAQKHLTRPELEERANQWELARQVLHNVSIACDAETVDRDQCLGWDGFTDEQLAKYHEDLLGEAVQISAN